MTIKRLDNVGVVVHDLRAVIAFFQALGLELECEAHVRRFQGVGGAGVA